MPQIANYGKIFPDNRFCRKPKVRIRLVCLVVWTLLRWYDQRNLTDMVTMNARKFNNQTSRPVASALPRPPEQFTVLIVDDDPDIVEVLAFFLELDGYQILKAYDGDEALQVVSERKPDLVLLDVHMPGVDGYAVCRHIKADLATAFIPVVIVTRMGGANNKMISVEAGADDYLNKPVNDVELRARVRSLLRMKGLHDTLEGQKDRLEEMVQDRTAQLEQALKKLRDLDRLKSEIINNVSHELRTPLTQVKNAVDLIEGCTSPDEMSALVSVAKNASVRLERLVKNITELGAGLNMQFEPVSIADSIYQAIVAMRAGHTLNGVQIEAVLDDDLPPVLADRNGLVRALQHLLDNAVKFSPDGGKIEVIARNNSDSVWVAVRDHGIGISESEIDNIFEQFYQVDGSATRAYGGVGIGLSIVKLIIEGHGSEIEVASTKGKGSTFSFSLPAATGQS